MANINYRKIPLALKYQEPFEGNTMRAFRPHETDEPMSAGRLVETPWRDKFELAKKLELIDYVVYSYNTPIAWVLRCHGEVIIPDVSYSTTTSKQQNLCRAYLKPSFEEDCNVE